MVQAQTDRRAQHVTKRRARGQIRVLWSKSINDATARLSSKIEALQAARRQTGQRAHAYTRKGARRDIEKGRQGVKGAQDERRGDG